MRIIQVRKFKFFLLILTFLSTLWFFYIYCTKDDRNLTLKLIDELIKTKASNLACKQPNLQVNSPEIMKFVHTVPSIDCSKAGIDWVKCKGSICSVQETAKMKFGPIECYFTDVYRKNDFKLTQGSSVLSDTYKLNQTDVVKVFCTSKEKSWSSTLVGIRSDEHILKRTNWDEVPRKSLQMNVLIFGFDSLSRNAFIRKLPKSYDYLRNVLKTDILEGYNIVGDGTPQALIPILTGKTELELPDTRKRMLHSKFVDIYPFIWNNYKNAGYVTGFFEDVPELSTFTYRLKGFKKQPTDHYMRNYYLASINEKINKWPKFCAGEIPRHKVMFNLIEDFFTVYRTKPKFLFGFHGELSHDDYNLIGVADDDFLQFLKNLLNLGVLNNTLLIIMADHGHRFAEVRNTIQGKQEERLPFFSFTFPEWFKKSKRYHIFQDNTDKLTTPFDIYATLKNILDMKYNYIVANISNRAVSLFTRIPETRSCADAYIEPHWCACLDWTNIPLTEPIAIRVVDHLINTLNTITKDYRKICSILTLYNIHWVTKMVPNQNLLKFNKNSDKDGFVGDFTANMKLKEAIYQVKIMTFPGKGLFEASITHDLSRDTFNLKTEDISRINMYEKQAKCVEENLPHLRKYCYCKDHS